VTVIDRQKTLETPVNPAVETFVANKLIISPTTADIPYQSRTPIMRAVFTPTSDGTLLPTSTLQVVTDYPTYTPTTAVYLYPELNSTKTPKKTPIQANTKSVDPPGAIALCNDGTYSFLTTRPGACSQHFGVKRWIP
jgi:serine/threonine-protein kinase